MTSLYCPTCHTMLLKAKLFVGQVKCHKCKALVDLDFVSQTGLDNVLTRSKKSSTLKK